MSARAKRVLEGRGERGATHSCEQGVVCVCVRVYRYTLSHAHARARVNKGDKQRFHKQSPPPAPRKVTPLHTQWFTKAATQALGFDRLVSRCVCVGGGGG